MLLQMKVSQGTNLNLVVEILRLDFINFVYSLISSLVVMVLTDEIRLNSRSYIVIILNFSKPLFSECSKRVCFHNVDMHVCTDHLW